MLKVRAERVDSPKTCYVYCWTNKRNGKRYFGKGGAGPAGRVMDHVNDARRGMKTNLLVEAMIREGVENFELRYMFIGLEEQEALTIEKFYIRRFRTNVFRHGWGNGYNRTDGGEGVSGFKLSGSAKRRLAELASSENVSFLRRNVETVLFIRALGVSFKNIAQQFQVAQSSLTRVLHEERDAAIISRAIGERKSLQQTMHAWKIPKKRRKNRPQLRKRADELFMQRHDDVVRAMPTIRFIVQLGYVSRCARFFGMEEQRFMRLLRLCSH